MSTTQNKPVTKNKPVTNQPSTSWPRMVADIGGTNARFALEVAPQQIEQAEVLPCHDYDTIIDAASAIRKSAMLQLPSPIRFWATGCR